MTEKQLNAYKNRFANLKEEEKIQIAEILVDEIQKNIPISREEKNIYSDKCIQTIKDIISLNNHQKEEEKNIDLIKRFSHLSYKNKIEVLNSMAKAITKIEKKEEEKAHKKQCKEEGHVFSKWERKRYTKTVLNPYYHSRDYVYCGPGEEQKYIPKEYDVWERACKRCGFVEQVEKEPKEVTEEKKPNRKKEKLRNLKNS